MWGGAYVDGDDLVVKSVGYGLTEAEAILRSYGVTQNVRIVESPISMAELETLTAEIMTTSSDQVTTAGPQYSDSQVVVGLSSSDADLLRRLYEIGGERVRAYDAPGQPRASARYHDGSPFLGGGLIGFRTTNSPFLTSTCSSAFPWKRPDTGNF